MPLPSPPLPSLHIFLKKRKEKKNQKIKKIRKITKITKIKLRIRIKNYNRLFSFLVQLTLFC